MGTNYYARMPELTQARAILDGIEDQDIRADMIHALRDRALHIGKSSGGWCFSLHAIPERGLTSWSAWKAYLQQPGVEIFNEYERRQQGLRRGRGASSGRTFRCRREHRVHGVARAQLRPRMYMVRCAGVRDPTMGRTRRDGVIELATAYGPGVLFGIGLCVQYALLARHKVAEGLSWKYVWYDMTPDERSKTVEAVSDGAKALAFAVCVVGLAAVAGAAVTLQKVYGPAPPEPLQEMWCSRGQQMVVTDFHGLKDFAHVACRDRVGTEPLVSVGDFEVWSRGPGYVQRVTIKGIDPVPSEDP